MMYKKFLKTVSTILAVSALVFTLGCGSDKPAKYRPMEQEKAVAETLKDLNPVVNSALPLQVVVSTVGHNKDGYVACCELAFSDFYVVDKKNNRVARVYGRPGYKDFFTAPYFRFERLPFPTAINMVIYKADKNSPDAKLGWWDDDAHVLPVYVIADFTREGDLFVKEAKTGAGENPNLYNAPLSDPKNIEMVKLLFSELTELNLLMKEQGRFFAVP